MTTDLRARAESALAVPLVHNIVGPLIRDLVAALPPDPAPTGERRVCAGWRVDSDGSAEMEAGPFDLATRPAQIGPMVYWEVAFGDLSADVPRQGSENGAEAAQLAAESAAAELLRAGLRALGRVK